MTVLEVIRGLTDNVMYGGI